MPRLAPPAPPNLPPGRRLAFGRFYPAGRGAPVVVLVSGVAGRPAQWDAFVVDLHRAGLAAFTYGSRDNQETDPTVLAREIERAIRALPGRRVLLAGASVGGSAVIEVLARRPGLPGGVAFDAGPTAARPHDLLLITDPREPAALHGENVRVAVAPSAGHGSALLRDPRVRARAVRWLARRS